jgi:NNP family nitrate/nitrite transporter-like MFS transporter
MTSYKATRISLFSLGTAPMRAFHLTWMAFFICFFAWFACAPLMPVIKQDLGLTTAQIANINIAAVAVTILVRLVIGPLCDRYGPRITYCGLLLFGSLPVFGVAFAQSYESFLFMRLLIGAVGASFVITQYHTSVMFAPNVVGTANAAVAGWGNAGGGAVQGLMPLILSAVLIFGVGESLGWRIAMIVPGVMMLIMAALYWRYTQDCPEGNYSELRRAGIAIEGGKKGGWASFKTACRNYRVWLLFFTYGGCFGVEIFFHNMAAVYIVDQYGMSLKSAGMAIAGFGLLALFARALGGWFSDKAALAGNVNSRTRVLFVFMLGEGLGLLAFANSGDATFAILSMLIFGLFTHMACGATYAIVPFIDRKALGGVAGIIGAGGNVGAVAAGFLMKGLGDAQQTMLVLGIAVSVTALCALAVRLAPEEKTEESGLLAPANFTA